MNVPVDLFSSNFKLALENLLVSCNEAKKIKELETKGAEKKSERKDTPTDVLTQAASKFIRFFFDEPRNSLDPDKAEALKTTQHLTFVVEKFSNLFDIEVKSGRFAADRGDQIDSGKLDGSTIIDNDTLSPAQRRNILMRKAKVITKYDGNPDTMPVRSDEISSMVRLLLYLSNILSVHFQAKIDGWYYKNTSIFNEMFRQFCSPPCIYRRGDDDWDGGMSCNESYDNILSADSSFCNGIRKQQMGKARLPPRIHLRPLASYKVLSYIGLFYFVMVILMGKSMVVSSLYLALMLFGYLLIKAVVSPVDPKDLDLTRNSTTLQFDGSINN